MALKAPPKMKGKNTDRKPPTPQALLNKAETAKPWPGTKARSVSTPGNK